MNAQHAAGNAADDRMADYLQIEQPYGSQWELMRDFMSLLDIRLYYLYRHHMWVGPENGMQNMMGLVVSRQEFEINLEKAVESVVGAELEADETADLTAINRYFSIRLQNTKQARCDIPVINLMDKFKLSLFESNCLLLAFCVHLEKKYEKLFAYLQDDITKKQPSAVLSIHLFAQPGDSIADYYPYFLKHSALARFFLASDDAETLFNRKICLRSRIISFLLQSEQVSDGDISVLFKGNTEDDSLLIREETAGRINAVLPALQGIGADRAALLFVSGRKGSGRRFLIRHTLHIKKAKCLFVSLKAILESGGNPEEILNDCICRAVLEQAYLCFCEFESLLDEEAVRERHVFASLLNDSVPFLGGSLFIVSEKEWKETGLCSLFVKIDIPVLPAEENERLELWRHFTENLSLTEDIRLEELASKFRFTPGQIRDGVSQAAGLCELRGNCPIDAATLHKCCYAQAVMHLDTLATPVHPAYNWNDLILPQDQVTLLQEACSHVKYRHTVFHEWGYRQRVAYGSGLSMLFSGPPGTGKTMAAQVVANSLHMEMYKIQLSQIVSKYIGETEKNLRRVFNEAGNANCILFFDETDALFGKRSEVKDAHDRNANIEVAYLLQQMEEYEGVIIMATNLLQNIDAAFLRRINFVISFPFPDIPTRLGLWKKMLDTKVPVGEDVNLEFLAEQFKIAGGNIKNIVLHAAFLAAAEGSAVTMTHLLRSTVTELRKSNIIVVKEDLGEYADLIFRRPSFA